MIVSIVADYFRKHEHLELSLTTGLNVLRGPNESGKTTIAEIVLYALYGAKALRNTLADTVTWGQKENALKAKLVIRIGAIDYVFTRSKAGAEVIYDTDAGPLRITGQAEVSTFAAGLMGADARTASLLNLSSQNGLRGSLEDGPAAVSALMGKLANFDLIDQLLEASAAKLALGAELPWAEKLAAAEAEESYARDAIDPVDNAALLKKDVADLEPQLDSLNERTDKLQDAMLAANEALEAGKVQAAVSYAAMGALMKLRQDLEAEKGKLVLAQADAAKMPDAARATQINVELASIAGQQRYIDAHRAFLKLPAYPEVYWDKPEDDFTAALDAEKAEVEALRLRQSQITGELRQLVAGKITNGKCPTCGSTKTSDEHVAAINGAIDAKMVPLQAEAHAITSALAGKLGEVEAMNNVREDAVRRAKLVASFTDCLTFDCSVYPPRMLWTGEPPVARDAAPLKTELAVLQAAANAATQAQGRVSAHTAAIADLEAAVQRSSDAYDALPVALIGPLTEAYNTAASAYEESSSSLFALKQKHEAMLREVAEYERAAQEQAKRFTDAQAAVVVAQADFDKLRFNNAFVKKLKSLKPAITDYLWNNVLSAVSNFFSTLRGEQSVVTKTVDGFRVNDKSIESLSGSTLDVLALAIRVALSKTFVPHASFMVLDEPAHGCDVVRTGNVLGFLSSVGFEQTLLASHDELSESVANNVITVGV